MYLRFRSLLFLVMSSLIFFSACEGGAPALDHDSGDMALQGDMNLQKDLSENDLSSEEDMNISNLPTTLSFVAGGLGGNGNIDGTRGAARFQGPFGVACDQAGNVYVTDTLNNTIRKVDTNGTVTTLAGSPGQFGSNDGTGPSARFRLPEGLAYGVSNGNKNLYVADSSNATIRVVNAETRAVTLLAGTSGMYPAPGMTGDGTGPNARFMNPMGVTIDNTGTNLYVADSETFTIRKVEIATGKVTTIAGAPGQQGIVDCIGSDDGTTDGGTTDGGTTDGGTTDGGTTDGGTTDGGTTDGGTTDGGTTDGGTTDGGTTDGGTTDGGTTDGGTTDGGTADGGTTDGGTTDGGAGAGTCAASDSRFVGPQGLTFGFTSDGKEVLYVVDSGVCYDSETDQILPCSGLRQVFLASHAVVTLAKENAPIALTSPSGVALVGTDNLYVSDNAAIKQVNLMTGEVTDLAGSPGEPGYSDGTGASARFYNPRLMAPDTTGNLYVADSSNNEIRKIVATGTDTGKVTTAAGATLNGGSDDGTGDKARFNIPAGVTSDGQGTLYVADSGNNTIRRVVIATGAVTTIAGTAGAYPFGDNGDGTGTSARFSSPEGIAYVKASDGKGYLYVADRVNHTIRQVALGPPVIVTTVAGVGGTPPDFGNGDGTGAGARFNGPAGLTSDGADTLYVADSLGNIVRKLIISTRVATTVVHANAGLLNPQGVALDGMGSLYVSDSGYSAIRKVDLSTGNFSIVAGSTSGEQGYVDATGISARFAFPTFLSSDGMGALYIVEGFNHAIRKLELATGAVTTFAGAKGRIGALAGPLPSSLSAPTSVFAINPSNVVIADENGLLLARP
jgi:hypothetical protein